MSRSSNRGQPVQPQWRYSSSAVDLKQDILTRIEAYFEYDDNVSQTPLQVYQDWLNGVIHRASPTRVCKYALDEVQLRTLRWTQGTQLSKKVMLLSPFDKAMEEPEAPTQTNSKSNDDFTAIEAEESNVESITTTTSTLPAVVEGTASNVIGDMIPNDEALQKMILSIVETHLVEFRKQMLMEIKADMKSMMTEVMTNTMEDREKQSIFDQGQEKISELLNVNKPRIIEHIGSAVKEIQKTTENEFKSTMKQHSDSLVTQIRDKEQVIIRNIAVKRDEVLEAINVEADQAIEDFLSASKEQLEKVTVQEPKQAAIPIKQGHVHSRFPNVDQSNLKVDEDFRAQPRQYSQRGAHRDHEESKISAYGFHKYFKAKLRNDTQILNFYQQLHKQGSPYGIHCVPLQDIHPNVDLCPKAYTPTVREEMALTIYQKLQDEDCVSIGYKKAQRLILQYASVSDGYRVLEQLLRSVHPNLKHSTSHTYDVPKLSSSFGNLYDYGSKIMNYILMQKIKQRTYSQVEQTIMFLNNMDEKKYNEAKNRALAEVRQITSTGNTNLDPNLMLESLPTTLEQYHEQIHGTAISQPQRFVRSMYDMNDAINLCDDVSEGDDAIVRAFGRKYNQRNNYQNERSGRYNERNFNARNGRNYDSPAKQCKACGKWGCSERKCQFAAKVHLAINFIKENSSAAAKLAEEYLRTNNRRTRMSTIRTLTASLSHESGSIPNDEDILNHYELDIPMEEVDFSSQEE